MNKLHNRTTDNSSKKNKEDIDRRLYEKIHMAIPAVITNNTRFAANQSVSVRPLIDQTSKSFVALEHSEIYEVPVVFPSGAGGLLSFPLQEGDTVLLVFCKEPLSEWLYTDGGQNSPKVLQKFRYQDCFALPCAYTTKNHLKPDPDNVELKYAGSTAKLFKNGDVLVSSAKDATVSAAGNINLNSGQDINITASGNVNISGSSINLN